MYMCYVHVLCTCIMSIDNTLFLSLHTLDILCTGMALKIVLFNNI